MSESSGKTDKGFLGGGGEWEYPAGRSPGAKSPLGQNWAPEKAVKNAKAGSDS